MKNESSKQTPKKVLRKTVVSGSVCVHKNQERIDYGTNICKDCRRLINTLKQTDR